MEFEALGPLRVRRDGHEVVVSGPLSRTLLAVLVARAGHHVSVPVLADALWPGDPDDRSARRLQLHVSKLRGHLGDPARIVFEHDGYRLDVAQDELDARRFESLVDEATEALGAGDVDRSVGLFRQGLALWRGDAFADIETPTVVAEAARLGERRLTAVEQCMAAEISLDRAESIVPELTALVGAHPVRERLHELLMSALARCGRQAEALRAFRTARSALVEQLGIEPGPELQRLQREVLAGTVDLSRAERFKAPAQLPPLVRSFVGRDDVFAGLDAALSPGVVAGVAVVTGSAGTGKTAATVMWAHRHRDRFPDGQLYIDLRGFDPDPPIDPLDALGSLLGGLGVASGDVPAGLADRAAMWRTAVDGCRLLVVLDNASDAEHVRPLLPGSATCRVIVTSRHTLTGLGVREGAHRVDVGLLPAADAHRLLADLVGERGTDLDAVGDALAERCGRLPLALRVAAEVVRSRPSATVARLVDELADRQTRLDVLHSDDARAAVRTVMSWSYDQLSPAAAHLFRLCSQIAGADTDAYQLAALAGVGVREARRTAEHLVDAHLLTESTDGRFGLHDLLRAYAAERSRADAPDDVVAAVLRTEAWALATAAAAMDRLAPHDVTPRPAVAPFDGDVVSLLDPAAALAWLDSERHDLVRLATRSVAAGRRSVANDLAAILFRYLDNQGHYDVAATLFELVRRAAHDAGDGLAAAHAARYLGVVHFRRGHHQAALELDERAYRYYRDAGERRWEGRQLNNIAADHIAAARYAEACSNYERALDLFAELADDAGRLGVLIGLGFCLTRLGDRARARDALSEAIGLADELDNELHATVARGHLGVVLALDGDDASALALLESSLEHARRTGDQITSHRSAALGPIYWRLGRRQEAFDVVQLALDASQRSGRDRGQVSELHTYLGDLHRWDGNHAAARVEYSTALRLAEAQSEPYGVATASVGLGALAVAEGRPDDARRWWTDAATTLDQLGVPGGDELRARIGLPLDA